MTPARGICPGRHKLAGVTADEQKRWNDRYSTGEYQPRTEHSPIVDTAIEFVGSGRALVLACGTGRNALRLAEAGFAVTAVDISTVAIEMARESAAERGLEVDWQVLDAGQVDLSTPAYDLITMIRYVNRSLWSDLPQALTSDGWLLMEQHLRTHRPVIGPSDDYRLDPGELLNAFSDLRVIEYSELLERSDRADALIASVRMLACKGDPGW